MACEQASETPLSDHDGHRGQPSPALPNPMFEYQHASGTSQHDALGKGFASWASMDLVTLIDACQTTLENCAVLEVSYAQSDDEAVYRRQVLLGPMAHFQQYPPRALEEHEFCPCCLFSNSMSAFTELLQSRDFLGVRLYVSRDADGNCEADCRVNGHDFPAAVQLLCDYANLCRMRAWSSASSTSSSATSRCCWSDGIHHFRAGDFCIRHGLHHRTVGVVKPLLLRSRDSFDRYSLHGRRCPCTCAVCVARVVRRLIGSWLLVAADCEPTVARDDASGRVIPLRFPPTP